MKSNTVQFREDEEAIRYLRSQGLNPNEFGKEAFQAALRRLRAEERMRELSKVQARLDRSPEEIIREERESH